MIPRPPVSRARALKLMAGIAGCCLATCLLADCTAARSELGTTDSPCYLALPAATAAAGPHSRLVGVHLLRLDALGQRSRRLFDALPVRGTPRQRVCVIGFSGSFTKASVTRPYGRESGHLAVVVLDNPSNQLIGTVIFDRAPLQFGHSHIG
jgi:hypothetical protein